MEGISTKDISKSGNEAERAFHEERWASQADAVPKPLFGDKPTAEDVMRTEADADHKDFENRQHEEFEAWQQNLDRVKESFLERAQNPESKKKTLIMMMGGGMRVGYTAGQVLGLNEIGLTADKVDVVIGASSGSVVASAYVAGPEQTRKSVAMFRGPLSSSDFINASFKRLVQGNVIDLQFAKGLMNTGDFAFDEDAIKQAPTELYYAVTENSPESGYSQVEFLDSKKLPSLTEGIVASMSIPGVTGPVPEIQGETYYDGAFNPLPIFDILEKFPDVTDIMILPQMPFQPMDDIKPSSVEKGMASLAGAASLDLFEKMLLSRKELRTVLGKITETSHVNIGIMWPPAGELSTTNIDGDLATAAVLESARDTIAQFGGIQPEHILPDLGQPLEEDGQRAA
jgi:predicted acylesterase/phospholipase RssA